MALLPIFICGKRGPWKLSHSPKNTDEGGGKASSRPGLGYIGITLCLPEPLTLLAEEVTACLGEMSVVMLHRSIRSDYILPLDELSTFWEATQGKQPRIGEKPLCVKMSIALLFIEHTGHPEVLGDL